MPSRTEAARPAARRSSRVLRAGAAALAAALVGGLVGVPAAWSATKLLPTPKAPVAQPVAAEALQPYVPQTSCDPRLKKGVRKFRDLMLATYPRGTDGGSTRACTAGGKSEHYEGRAWDWMLDAGNSKDKKVADAAIAWLLAPGPDGAPALEARRLGIMYVIYNHRIWGTWSGKWKRITSGDPHTSHIHLSFSWAGAKARTSFWTGKVGTVDYGPCAAYSNQPARIYAARNPYPCPTNLPSPPRSTHKLAWTGSTGKDVALAQQLLKVPAASRTATFGTAVRKAVIAYQKAKGLPVTGALDKATWVRLDPSSRIGTGAIPAPAPMPSPPPVTTTTSSGDAGTLPAATTWVTVRAGDSGPGVLAVQKALKLTAANRTGYFGSVTFAAVKAFQQARGLSVDGVVGPVTAKALGLVA